MSDDDNEEDFSTTFRRFIRVMEEQAKLAKLELRKVHGLQMEVSAPELRQKLGEQAKRIRSLHAELVELPERPLPSASPRLDYDCAGITCPPGGGSFRPADKLLMGLVQKATMYVEWAAHLKEDKVYMLSTHDWISLFGDPMTSPSLGMY